MITKDSSQNQIKAWQSFLEDRGYHEVGADGTWGPVTENATKKFQQTQNLNPDGKVGPDTLKAAENLGFIMPQPETFPQSGLIDVVFDVSHHNAVVDFTEAHRSGMMAVFHKASQSLGPTLMLDKMYPIRKKEAIDAGLLWGAYHFGSGGSGQDQALTFLDNVKPDHDTLLVLDFEPNTTHGETTMSLAEAAAFVEEIQKQTGKFPGIYSGNLLKESIGAPEYDVLTNCWLWIAQYSHEVHLPNGWSDFTFWQYTDGVNGPSTLPVPGTGQCDREVFKGTPETLKNFWSANQV